jgi:hypothetical protein
MSTEVRRIDMTQSQNLANDITLLCNNMLAGKFQLASTFVQGTQLILVFQKLSV